MGMATQRIYSREWATVLQETQKNRKPRVTKRKLLNTAVFPGTARRQEATGTIKTRELGAGMRPHGGALAGQVQSPTSIPSTNRGGGWRARSLGIREACLGVHPECCHPHSLADLNGKESLKVSTAASDLSLVFLYVKATDALESPDDHRAPEQAVAVHINSHPCNDSECLPANKGSYASYKQESF